MRIFNSCMIIIFMIWGMSQTLQIHQIEDELDAQQKQIELLKAKGLK